MKNLSPDLRTWLEGVSGEIESQFFPRTWVEKVAISSGFNKPRYNGGLGNPLRSNNPTVIAVRNAIGRVPNANQYGCEGGMSQAIEATQYFSAAVDGVKLEKEEITINETGSCEFLGLLAAAMSVKKEYLSTDRKLHVLIMAAAYPRHISVLPKRDVRYHLADLYAGEKQGGSFSDALEAALQRTGAKLVVLSSVYNPSTRVTTEQEMTDALVITQRYGAVLYFDDAYRHVYREARGPINSALRIPGALSKLICASLSASKGHQSPGKGASLVGSVPVVEMVREARKAKGEGGDIPTQIVWAALLRQPEYLVETRQAYDKQMAYLVGVCHQAGWPEFEMSDASIFVKAHVPATLVECGWTGNHLAQALAERGGIVYPNSFFPGHIEEWVRVCVTGGKDEAEQFGEIVEGLIKDPPQIEECWPQRPM